MKTKPSTFALFFGNRGFFPSHLMEQARADYPRVLKELGHATIMTDVSATRFGAVETSQEGQVFARFLRAHEGEYDGVLLILPNFGDENGAVAALRDVNVPILILAYPDDLDKMSPDSRRDAFCGKFSIMDVFCQNQIKFTALKPHAVAPGSARFTENIAHFDRVCRVVKGTRRMVIGAIGARTTAFKTVRIDELTLQKYGVTVETFDLASVISRVAKVDKQLVEAKHKVLTSEADCSSVPLQAQDALARLGVVLDQMIEEHELDAVSLRCWVELQEQLGISPCVLLGEINDRGIAASCEVDIGNALAMRALSLATGEPATCLDWNNNYADEDDKCILFHCGPVPMSLMAGKGKVVDHSILMNVIGQGRSYGCNVGRIKPMAFTYASMMTKDGIGKFYLGAGRFTSDPIPEEFFGCAGVARIDNLQGVLLHVGRQGYRHHVSLSPGQVMEPVAEALGYYLGYEVSVL